jgi:hypothetical protein
MEDLKQLGLTCQREEAMFWLRIHCGFGQESFEFEEKTFEARFQPQDVPRSGPGSRQLTDAENRRCRIMILVGEMTPGGVNLDIFGKL